MTQTTPHRFVNRVHPSRPTSARQITALVASLTALVTLLLSVGTAHATVVQDRQPGNYLIAHRWDAQPTGPQTLTVVAQPNVDWTTLTLLDFNRDGKPDAMVDFAWSPGQQDIVWQLYRLQPSVMAPGIGTTGGRPCFTPTSQNSTLVAGGHIPVTRRTYSWAVSLTRDFGADLGGDYAGLVRYQPILTTVFTPQARALGNAYVVNDILPNSADPVAASGDTSHQCSGLVGGVYAEGFQIAPERGSDRGQDNFAANRRQAMFNGTTTTDAGEPQLVESDILQWTASQTTTDLTGDVPNPTDTTYHPADLVLTMRADHPLDTVTYLVPDGGTQPIGLVTTSGAANQAPGQATLHVQLATNLSPLSYPDPSTGRACYPRSATTFVNGSQWGPDPISFDVPLTAVTGAGGQSDYQAEISLDQVLGIGNGGTQDRPAFRWVTTSVPAQHFAPQYTPDVAGLDENDQPFGVCTVPTSGNPDGTQLWPAEMVRMDTTLPSASLSSTPTAPHSGDTVTLSASTDASGASYRFDPEGGGTWGSYGASATTTHQYGPMPGHPFTARVYLVNGAGTGAMASTTIATDDPPPSASFNQDTGSPPPYVLDGNGPTITWNDHSTDTAPGYVKSWHWELHKTTWNGTGAITCDASINPTTNGQSCDSTSFSHTFVPGDQGDWVLTLTVSDDGGAQSSTYKTFHVTQPPVAIIDSITPKTILVNTNVFPVRADFQINMRTATDGSLGSDGPLTYFYAGAVGNGSNQTPPYTPFDFLQGGSTFNGFKNATGVYQVQAQVHDTAGRVATSPLTQVVVRAAGDDPPTAKLATSPSNPTSGATAVTFDASGSALNNPDGTTATPDQYQFDFGDGTPPVTSSSAIVQHTYAGSGHYTASVVALDDRFAPSVPSDPATADVTVAQGPTDSNAPVAKAARLHPDQPVYAKAPVVLTAAASTVKDGPATYAWDLDGNGTFETDTGTNADITATFDTAGAHHVKVRVTDAQGRVSVSDDLFVGVNPPNDQPPYVSLTGPDTLTLANGTAQAALDASRSVGRNHDPSLTYAWDLNGDGIYKTSTGSDPHVTATFTTSGTHTVRVRATDIYGNSDVASLTIFVRGAAEVAANCQSHEQYRTLTYGHIELTACWTQIDRPDVGPLWFARGDLGIDGMVLTSPTAGAADHQTFSDCSSRQCATEQSTFNQQHGGLIAFDPSNGQLASNMPYTWKATNGVDSFALNQRSLDLMLPSSADTTPIELSPPDGVKFLTLTVANQAEVNFPEDGVATIGLTMHMPPQMPGVSGDLTLRSTSTQGLIVDKLKLKVTTGLLAKFLKLANLDVEYDRGENLWSGSAELGIPGIKDKPDLGLTVAVSIKDGRFHSIYGEANGLEIDLGEGIFLQRIAAGIGVDPIDIQGGLGISAGPEILGKQILSANGDFRLTLPSDAAPYTLFQIAGVTRLADLFDLSKGVVRFTSDGFVEARGEMTRQSFIGYFDATIGGWFTPSDFNLSGDAQAGLLFFGDKIKLVGAKAVASKQGIAACGEIPVLNLGGGIGYHWGGSFETFTGCDLGPYSSVRPAGIPSGFIITGPEAGTAGFAADVRAKRLPAKAPTMVLPRHLRSVGITVHGQGGAPRVGIYNAKGKSVLDATRQQLTSRALVQFDPQTDTTSILWKAPPAGKLLVIAGPGSATITSVSDGLDFGLQHVQAKLTGRGAKQMLHWNVSPGLQPGQQLSLAEQLPAGSSVAPGGGSPGAGSAGRQIITTSRSRGAVSFVPEAGHGEERVITGTIITGGLARPPQVAARFRAPRLVVPSAPRSVLLRRSGTTVTVTWKPGARLPRAWQVQLQTGPARSTITQLSSAARSFRVTGIDPALPVAATVQGVAASGATGSTAHARLAAGQLRSDAGGQAQTAPRQLQVRRSGSKLVVSWRPGPARVRGYAVTVKIGHRDVVLLEAPNRRSITIGGLPGKRAFVTVVLRAAQLDGKLGTRVTVAGRR
jgi:PKD domain